MRRTAAVLLLLVSPLLSQQDGSTSASLDSSVRALMTQLGDEDPECRDAAERSLVDMGERDDSGRVEALIEEGARSSDPEVAARCRTSLDSIRYWERIVLLANWGSAAAIDLRTGEELWRREEQGIGEAFVWPMGRDAHAYLSGCEGLICADLRSGREVWRADGLDADGVLAGDGWVSVGRERLRRVSLRTGEIAWSAPIRWFGAQLSGLALFQGDGLVVRSEMHCVTGFDLATGDRRWRQDRGDAHDFQKIRGSLYAYGGLAWCPRQVSRLAPATGAILWRREFPTGGGWPVLFDGGAREGLIIASASGIHGSDETVALDEDTGEVKWSRGEPVEQLVVIDDGARAWMRGGSHLTQVDLATGDAIARAEDLDSFTLVPDGERLLALDEGHYGLQVVSLRMSDGQKLSTLRVEEHDRGNRAIFFRRADSVERLWRHASGWLLVRCYPGAVSLFVLDDSMETVQARYDLDVPRRPPPRIR